MSVVSNTSPLNYLILIDEAHLLSELFHHIIVPEAVIDELQHPKTSESVRAWIANPPPWLEVRSVTANPTAARWGLQAGERDAILLAKYVHADAVLIDELDGRRIARQENLVVIGALGILDRAAELGLVRLRDALSRLQITSFYAAQSLLESLVERDIERERRNEPK